MEADAYLIIVKAVALLAPSPAAGKAFDKSESPRPERRSGHRHHDVEKASGRTGIACGACGSHSVIAIGTSGYE